MIRALIILLAAACPAFGQTGITVMADTNRAVRTNFTIGNAQVTGLSGLLDAKLSTNGNGAALTNLTGGNVVGAVATASNITGILAISNGGTGSSSASNARTALGLGTAATNAATAFQPASTNLNLLADNNGGALTNLSATNFLPAYTSNDGKVLAVASGGTNIEWIAISNTVTDGSTITNIPVANLTGVLGVTSGGTGGSNASAARVNLLPAYTNNASKVLALNTNATDVEWITMTNGGGGTSGVTSVDVSGGSTGLTTSGGPITTSGTITIAGTLAIAAGGTGQTNAGAAIEGFLPAYSNNATKVLALNSNATSLEWITNGTGGGGSGTVTSVDASGGSTGMSFSGGPITTTGTLSLGGTLAIGSGGTGAGDVTNARINLLPDYTNNAGKALVLNTNGTDIIWAAIPSVPVSVTNGGTGATNSTNALINLGVIKDADSVALLSTNAGSQSVVIGRLASAISNNAVAIGNGAFADAEDGVAIGNSASSFQGVALGGQSVAIDGAAVGYSTDTANGGAVGYNAESVDGFAGGYNAQTFSTNGVQLGTGTNTNDNSIQFLSAGSVTTNAWTALANSTAFGHYVMAAPTNGTANQVLALNSNATAVVWTTNGGGGSGLPETPLAISNGGTGATNGNGALTNFGVLGTALVVLGGENITGGNTIVGSGATADDGSGGFGGVSVGRSAVGSNSSTAIGYNSRSLGTRGTAIGYEATNTTGRGVAIGYQARIAGDGFAIGFQAVATGTNSVQLGTGTITNSSSIQFLSSGAVDTNEWATLAALSTYPTTNIQVTVVGGATNTLVFSNGILTSVTSP